MLSLADVEDARLRLAALELHNPLMGTAALAQLLQVRGAAGGGWRQGGCVYAGPHALAGLGWGMVGQTVSQRQCLSGLAPLVSVVRSACCPPDCPDASEPAPPANPPAQRHYTRALLPELYKVVGSASVFGDPVRLFHHLGLGVWSFLASPAAGQCTVSPERAMTRWELCSGRRGSTGLPACVCVRAHDAAPTPAESRTAPPRLAAGLVESARQRGPRQFIRGVASGTQGLFQVHSGALPLPLHTSGAALRCTTLHVRQLPPCPRCCRTVRCPMPHLLLLLLPSPPPPQNVVFALSNAATKGSQAGRKFITVLGLDRLPSAASGGGATGGPDGWGGAETSFRRRQLRDSKCSSGVDQHGIHAAHAAIGVEQNGKAAGEENNENLHFVADAKKKDGDGDIGGTGNGPDEFGDGLQQSIDEGYRTHQKTKRDRDHAG